LVIKVKPNINSIGVHPQLSNNGCPVDGALKGAGSLWLSHTSALIYSTSLLCMVKTKDDLGRGFGITK